MRYLIVLLVCLAFSCTKKINESPERAFNYLTTDSVYSIYLAENRKLNLYLPLGYTETDTVTYPVLYVLDGSSHEDFLHIAGLVQFLDLYDIMPSTIVVGIANVDRRRDFTHPSNVQSDFDLVPTGGGSKKFISFIETELQPHISSNYKTNKYRTIIGQSLGGLLATEILLTKPNLFDDYIIVSPSLWWNGQSLVSTAAKVLLSREFKDKKVYLSIGNEGPIMQDGLNILRSAVENSQTTWFYVPFPEENHATILHRSVYKAFELLNN